MSQGYRDGGFKASRLRSVWCHVMHDAPQWPIHGQYRCGICGTHYPVPWEEAASAAGHSGTGVLRPARQAS